MAKPSFDALSPETTIRMVEEAYGLNLDGTFETYPSYVNRVYGLKDDEGERFVVKVYRPGRWSEKAILEEHRFILDCKEAEIPVASPLASVSGSTLSSFFKEDDEVRFFFTLFPRMGGRSFEPEKEEDFQRLGSLLGRCHATGSSGEAESRLECSPETTEGFAAELLGAKLVHPEFEEEFASLCTSVLDSIRPLFARAPRQRIHGDCHRGNILDRGNEGLLLVDFDDMMRGPPVQDFWLLLPGYLEESSREIEALIEGYERMKAFDRSSLKLVEPLRFMRIVYFLAWRSRQKDDYLFMQNNPDWGTKAFWTKEIEDLKTQAKRIFDSL